MKKNIKTHVINGYVILEQINKLINDLDLNNKSPEDYSFYCGKFVVLENLKHEILGAREMFINDEIYEADIIEIHFDL